MLAAIHFSALRDEVTDSADTATGDVRSRLHLLLPLVGIVALLALGRSPMRAAFWGVMLAFVTAMAVPATRMSPSALRRTLVAGAGGAVQVAAACAAAGIVVGIATLTGIGLRLSSLIVTLSGGELFIGLIWTALAGVVLGMGLPTTAAYVVLAALGAPALVELGAAPLAAHLFIFYFGCISNVTPPVSLAAYAAAGIAEASAFRTAVAAVSFAATGFAVPFAFIYSPGLLLQAPPAQIATTLVAALLGVLALAAATIGHHNRQVSLPERVVLVVAAAALLSPLAVARLAGGALILVSLTWSRIRAPRSSP